MNHAPPDFTNWSCPLPLRNHPTIVMGHGGGGKLTADLVQHLFVPAFANTTLATLADAAALQTAAWQTPGARLAFTTDSFVVRPLFFPGGNIGDLAVNGTVNDLAMSGARPLYLTTGFILEEGLPLATLSAVVEDLAAAARRAGVAIVAGDTKVVDRGHGDGIYITSAGIGVISPGVHLSPAHARPGDAILVSGTLADHGMAIMGEREGLAFESPITSDSAPLHGLVAVMLAACPEIAMLRDPTRGGVAASLNEIAGLARLGIEIDEASIPVAPAVAAACEILGLDPLQVANEGKLLAVVPADAVGSVLAAMRAHEHGRAATRIGDVVAGHAGVLALRTAIGGTRIVPLPVGEQLPRIC